MNTRDAQVERISNGLEKLLTGEDKVITLQAALSIVATTGLMLDVPIADLQRQLAMLYAKRQRESLT